MGRGSKLFRRNKATLVEEITELERVDERRKKSLQSMVKTVLKRGKKHNEKRLEEEKKAKYQIYLSQKEKVAELLTKLKWMESKQEGKEKRIEDMESRSLTLDEKIQLAALKNSSKRLEDKILIVNNELRRRRITINGLGIGKESSAKGFTSEKNAGFVAPQFTALRCWEDSSNITPEISASEVDPKQAATAKKYLDKSVNQKERVYELNEKLEWMKVKRTRKQEKIAVMKKEKLSFDDKVQLKGLKNSFKRLEKDISMVKNEISRREGTIKTAEELHQKCLTLPSSVEGSSTLVDIEVDFQ